MPGLRRCILPTEPISRSDADFLHRMSDAKRNDPCKLSAAGRLRAKQLLGKSNKGLILTPYDRLRLLVQRYLTSRNIISYGLSCTTNAAHAELRSDQVADSQPVPFLARFLDLKSESHANSVGVAALKSTIRPILPRIVPCFDLSSSTPQLPLAD